MENVHVGSHENCHEDLDSSQGFRVCNRCDYEAEDRYELDGHLWYGHEEDEDGHVFCKFCDEKFANIPNMMMHKKIKHREKIDFCQNYNAGGCPFENKKCWFHNTRNNEMNCNICEQTLNRKSHFIKHRRVHYPEMLKRSWQEITRCLLYQIRIYRNHLQGANLTFLLGFCLT